MAQRLFGTEQSAIDTVSIESNSIEFPDGRVSLGSDGILRAWAAPGAQESVDTARQHLYAICRLANGRRLPIIVDLRNIRSTDREARKLYSSEEFAACVCAAALIVESAVSRVIGNFYLGLNRAVYPTHLFSNESEALAWLEQFKR
jgi:hypothetical protein